MHTVECLYYGQQSQTWPYNLYIYNIYITTLTLISFSDVAMTSWRNGCLTRSCRRRRKKRAKACKLLFLLKSLNACKLLCLLKSCRIKSLNACKLCANECQECMNEKTQVEHYFTKICQVNCNKLY